MIFGVASQVRLDRLVPELLNSFPVLDLTALEQVADIVRSALGKSLVSDEVVQLWVVKDSLFVDSTLLFSHKL